MRKLLLILPLVFACVPEEAPDPGDRVSSDCGAENFEHLIGQNRSALGGMALPAATRVIGPGMAVTMDHNPGRLNISYNESDTIYDIRCG